MHGTLVVMQMDFDKQHVLGQRAFTLFLFKRIKFALFLFLLSWVAWRYEHLAPEEYTLWVTLGVQLLFALSMAYFALILIRTFLEYRRYTYRFTDEAFIVTEGYLVRNEFGAVYHQIQSVNIRRTPLDRMIGVSQLVILMVGPDRESRRAQIVLPGVGKTRAKLVQKELLIRARKHATMHPSPDD